MSLQNKNKNTNPVDQDPRGESEASSMFMGTVQYDSELAGVGLVVLIFALHQLLYHYRRPKSIKTEVDGADGESKNVTSASKSVAAASKSLEILLAGMNSAYKESGLRNPRDVTFSGGFFTQAGPDCGGDALSRALAAPPLSKRATATTKRSVSRLPVARPKKYRNGKEPSSSSSMSASQQRTTKTAPAAVTTALATNQPSKPALVKKRESFRGGGGVVDGSHGGTSSRGSGGASGSGGGNGNGGASGGASGGSNGFLGGVETQFQKEEGVAELSRQTELWRDVEPAYSDATISCWHLPDPNDKTGSVHRFKYEVLIESEPAPVVAIAREVG